MSTTNRPPVELTANGVTHHLPISPAPSAGEVFTGPDGSPVAPLVLGHLLTGEPVVISATSVEYLDDLDAALRVLRARLVVQLQDDPSGDDGDFFDVARVFGVRGAA
jgi:hypothetical protein